jgi:hypothetical protein
MAVGLLHASEYTRRWLFLRAGCCARENPGTLIGPGSLSPDRWVYGGALGVGPPRPGANATPWRTQWFLFIGASQSWAACSRNLTDLD